MCSQVVSKPGTTRTHTKFEGEVYALTKEEGGRHTPFTTNYSPQVGRPGQAPWLPCGPRVSCMHVLQAQSVVASLAVAFPA